MKNKGFVLLTVLLWFCALLLFIHNGLFVINQHLQTLENIRILEERSLIESRAVAKAKYMWKEFAEENYCEYVRDYEVCWQFKQETAIITVDYLEQKKILVLDYDFDCDCLVAIRRKVDK